MNQPETSAFSESILIKHPERVQEAKTNIRKKGIERFLVISDFAKTLTKEYVNGIKAQPIVAQLRTGNFLATEYAEKAHALYDQFAPKENDLSAGVEARNTHMLTWWRAHFDLLIKYRFSRGVASAVAAERQIILRERIKEFVHFLATHDIPLIIFTATPGDLVLAYLEQDDLLKANVHIAGNLYQFGPNEEALSMPDPIIHPHNKGQIPIAQSNFYSKIANRTNVLLLGDSLEDLEMLNSVPHDQALTVVFYNKPTSDSLEQYMNAFDIVLTGDSSMEAINDLLNDIFA